MEYITQCETNDYGLNNTGTNYALLFKTFTSISNRNHYNDNQIIFRILHMSSNSGVVEPKSYMLTCVKDGSNIINLIDLNPDIKGVEIGYVVENDVVSVYGKGNKTGAKLKLQVIYVSNLGMYEFISNSDFNNNVTITKPKNMLMKNAINTGLNPCCERVTVDTNKYTKIMTFFPYWGGCNGCASFKLTEIANSNLYGINSTVYVAYNGINGKINIVNSDNTRKLDFMIVKNGSNIEVYIKGYSYGNLIITPITYQTGDNCYMQYTIENPIDNYTGDKISEYKYYETIKPTLQNSWVEDTYFENIIIKQGNHVEVNIMCYNGELTENTIITTFPYNPIKSKYIPCVSIDSNENMTSGLLFLNTNGELKVHRLNSNNRVVCNFNYMIL